MIRSSSTRFFAEGRCDRRFDAGAQVGYQTPNSVAKLGASDREI